MLRKEFPVPSSPRSKNIIAFFKVPKIRHVNFQLRSIRMKMTMDRWRDDIYSGKRPFLEPNCPPYISYRVIRDRTPGLRHEWPAASRHSHGMSFENWRKHELDFLSFSSCGTVNTNVLPYLLVHQLVEATYGEKSLR
jgi:hypothetical protein